MTQPPKLSFYLVIGCPRSGTTNIAIKLATRLGASLLPEGQFLIDAVSAEENANRKEYVKRNWGEMPDWQKDSLQHQIYDTYEKYLNARCKGQNIVVEHTPQLCLHPKAIKLLNPREIYIAIRNPADSYLSLMRQPWHTGGVIRTAIYVNRIYAMLVWVACFSEHAARVRVVDIEKMPRTSPSSIYGNSLQNFYLHDSETARTHCYRQCDSPQLESTAFKFFLHAVLLLIPIIIWRIAKCKLSE